MNLSTRLAKLESNRPAQSGEAVTVDLASDLVERIEAAKAAGTFPKSLASDDLRAVLLAVRISQEQK